LYHKKNQRTDLYQKKFGSSETNGIIGLLFGTTIQ
jgi:hypothetical protein